MGGYERHPAPWSLDGIPADFNGKLLAPDWPRFAEIMDGAVRRVPAIADAGRQPDDQRPGGVHPGQRVHPRRERGPRVLRGGRASAPTASPAPAGSAARWPAGSSRASRSSTCGRWTSAGSGPSTGARPTPWPGPSRSTRPTTTSTTRTRSARPAGRSASRRPTLAWSSSAAAFGEKSGWERPNWFESNAAAGDEGLRPRGWAGQHWSPAIGAEALATRTRGRPVRRVELQQDRGRRAGRDGVPPAAVRQRHRPAGRHDRLHPDAQPARPDRVRLHGHPAGRGPVPHRDRDGVRQPRPGLDPEEPRRARGERRAGLRRGPDERAGLPRAVGTAGARHPGRLHPRRRLRRRLPVPHRAPDHRRQRAAPRAPGDLRRRARLGALPADRVRPGPVGHAVGGRPRARPGRRRVPGDRRAPAREGLPRLVERHHPRRDPVRGRSRVRGAPRQGRRRSSAARPCSRRGRPVRAGACAASSSTTRARSPSATSRSGSTARSSAG